MFAYRHKSLVAMVFLLLGLAANIKAGESESPFAEACVLMRPAYAYERWRDSLLADKTKLEKFLAHEPASPNERAVKFILTGWKENEKTYRKELVRFAKLEEHARTMIRPMDPAPALFFGGYIRRLAPAEREAYLKPLVPLMLECLWVHPEWRCWRKRVAAEILMEYGDAIVVPPLIARLAEEEGDVMRALREIIIRHGDLVALRLLQKARGWGATSSRCIQETCEYLERRLKEKTWKEIKEGQTEEAKSETRD